MVKLFVISFLGVLFFLFRVKILERGLITTL